METTNLDELSLQELKKMCKDKNIETTKKDTKEILIAKLKDYASTLATRNHTLTNVRDKMKETKLIIVTKNDPTDTRDSFMATITNATGSYEYPIAFNKKIRVPVPFVKYLQNAKVQKFRKVKTKYFGEVDEGYLDNRYIVQILEEDPKDK